MYDESNNFCEVLISREPDKKVILVSRIYVALAVITGLLALFVNLLYLILTVACILLRRSVLNKASVEFEYEFWGRQLDVDLIRNGEKRDKLVTYLMDEVEILAREGDPLLEDYRALLDAGTQVKTRDLTDQDPQGRPVYIMYAHEDVNLVQVRLQPSHEMLRQMWRVAPRIVHIPESIRREPEDLPDEEA